MTAASGSRTTRVVVSAPTDPIDSVDWQDLNGTVDPNTAGVTPPDRARHHPVHQHRQQPDPPRPGVGRHPGQRHPSQVDRERIVVRRRERRRRSGLVDPTDFNYVYGNYFGISRVSEHRRWGGASSRTRSSRGGINLADRSDFYVPEIMNQGNPNQLFLGTYRVYRTDNAKADDAARRPLDRDQPGPHVGLHRRRGEWRARLPDQRARRLERRATASMPGPLEGWVQFSPDAVTNPSPTWTRVGQSIFPNRPVSDIAVDRSNDRIAYAGFNGYNAGTPSRPGHVFATTDGGAHWNEHQLQPAGRPGQLAPDRRELPEHALCRHGRRPLRDLQRRQELAGPRQRLPDRRGLAAQPRSGEPEPRRRDPRSRRVDDA